MVLCNFVRLLRISKRKVQNAISSQQFTRKHRECCTRLLHMITPLSGIKGKFLAHLVTSSTLGKFP